jgi:hypothetical protein
MPQVYLNGLAAPYLLLLPARQLLLLLLLPEPNTKAPQKAGVATLLEFMSQVYLKGLSSN